ncbi:hypothetical protein [Myxococcus xanthus]|uniref:hypothetical protein n=1 Tax=Myxococcus xanthus TaxID=34 RepID=UPI00112BEE4A|nr:hypothetical protein [Myxococcus xanthus]QDF05045.1 hypothetical protein BHS04_17805 [Myxococcus xanthus]
MSTPLTEEKLAAIRERHAAASRGPWYWSGYTRGQQLGLHGPRMSSVMEFHRWGMQSAQPVFCVDGILRDVSELVVPDTNPHRGRITDINHPDARFIAASWEDVRDLLAHVATLEAALEDETRKYKTAWTTLTNTQATLRAAEARVKALDAQFRATEREKRAVEEHAAKLAARLEDADEALAAADEQYRRAPTPPPGLLDLLGDFLSTLASTPRNPYPSEDDPRAAGWADAMDAVREGANELGGAFNAARAGVAPTPVPTVPALVERAGKDGAQ